MISKMSDSNPARYAVFELIFMNTKTGKTKPMQQKIQGRQYLQIERYAEAQLGLEGEYMQS